MDGVGMKVKNEKGVIFLNPVLIGGVWYVEAKIQDFAVTLRGDWNRYSAKKCAGSDAHGRYYNNRTHADRVIKEFKKKASAA